MPVYLLGDEILFPPVDHAEDGLLAVGGDLTPQRLLAAYSQGIFPWYSEGEPILWHSPDPRFVLTTGSFRIPRRLDRASKAEAKFRVSLDEAFEEVIRACARAPRPGQTGTWITEEMKEAYIELHRLGFAHSVEAWEGSPQPERSLQPSRSAPPAAASLRAEASARAKSEGALDQARSDEPRGWGPHGTQGRPSRRRVAGSPEPERRASVASPGARASRAEPSAGAERESAERRAAGVGSPRHSRKSEASIEPRQAVGVGPHGTERSLAGGIYGVSLGGAFFGESMFARRSDASKIGFVALVKQLERWGIDLIDCQVRTPHMARFGARNMPRGRYLEDLKRALEKSTRRGKWQFDSW